MILTDEAFAKVTLTASKCHEGFKCVACTAIFHTNFKGALERERTGHEQALRYPHVSRVAL